MKWKRLDKDSPPKHGDGIIFRHIELDKYISMKWSVNLSAWVKDDWIICLSDRDMMLNFSDWIDPSEIQKDEE